MILLPETGLHPEATAHPVHLHPGEEANHYNR
jgi:hypothetical protein